MSTTTGSTTVTVLTAEGRSAIAVVAVVGPLAEQAVDQYFRAANGKALAQQPLARIVYGRWGSTTGEDLVICRRDTSWIEVHCHGGVASIAQVVDHLVAAGCQQTTWQEWLADHAADPLFLEAHTALAEASTLRTAKVLLDQYHGALHCAMLAIRLLLSEGAARIAHEKLQELLGHAALGLHLTQPWRVVIAGLPNVGKSSLINALVGYQRAIVFDQPGTTRDVVTATTAIEGWPVSFSDTAGLHQTADELENKGIALARKRLSEADLVIWVLDAQEFESQETTSCEELIARQLKTSGVEIDHCSLLLVVNKIDLLGDSAPNVENLCAVSALAGTDLDTLLSMIANSLVPQPPPTGVAIPFTARQVTLLKQMAEHCQQEQCEQALETLAIFYQPS